MHPFPDLLFQVSLAARGTPRAGGRKDHPPPMKILEGGVRQERRRRRRRRRRSLDQEMRRK